MPHGLYSNGGRMNKKIIAFGEIMLRLNPHEYYRFSQADDFAATYTGAEANVCAALSLYGCSTEFVTAVPDNDIADCALQTMKKVRRRRVPCAAQGAAAWRILS